MFLLLFVVTAGIVFGLALSSEIGALRSASDYYATVVKFFFTTNSAAVQVIFIVGLFCMIFTTLNNLLLTIMQIRFYGRGLGRRRGDLSRILVLASICSVFISADAVCAFGIFVGAILLLPCVQVFGQVFHFPFTPPASHRYLWAALVLSGIVVGIFRGLFLEDFGIHYAIPGIVLLSATMCGLIAVFLERISQRNYL